MEELIDELLGQDDEILKSFGRALRFSEEQKQETKEEENNG